MLSRRINDEIKQLIRSRKYNREEIVTKIYRKYGNIANLLLWYDICYNSVCEELGIDRKHGEELKPKSVRLKIGKNRK